MRKVRPRPSSLVFPPGSPPARGPEIPVALPDTLPGEFPRNGIVPSGKETGASEDPGGSQEGSPEKAETEDRLAGIFRAAGMVDAAGRQEGREEHPVSQDGQNCHPAEDPLKPAGGGAVRLGKGRVHRGSVAQIRTGRGVFPAGRGVFPGGAERIC